MLFGHIFASFGHIFCAFRPHILCSSGSNHHVLELLYLFRQVDLKTLNPKNLNNCLENARFQATGNKQENM